MVAFGGALVLAGALLGAFLFRAEPAEAQRGPYRLCAVGHQETHDINGRGEWERAENGFNGDRIIRIPQGWEVVGAGGGAAPNARLGFITICRR